MAAGVAPLAELSLAGAGRQGRSAGDSAPVRRGPHRVFAKRDSEHPGHPQPSSLRAPRFRTGRQLCARPAHRDGAGRRPVHWRRRFPVFGGPGTVLRTGRIAEQLYSIECHHYAKKGGIVRMATEIRTSAPSLTQPSNLTEVTMLPNFAEEEQQSSVLAESPLGMDLHDDAPSFQFFQAVALLQRMLSDRRPVGQFYSPEDETVRFHVNPRMGFPASEIQQLQVHNDAPADMMVNFMGLTGPQGVLPHVYSELILERLRAKDRSLAAFLDIFNHRAISLFYRAWQRTFFPVNYSTGPLDYFSQ